MVNPEVFACHLVFRGCKNLPHFCYVKSFWPVVPFNVIRFVWHWKLSIFCWTMTQIDVWCQKLSKLRNAGSICCINLYTRPIHLAKFLFLVSQWPPERRLHVQYMYVYVPWWAKILPNCLVATSPSGWFWCRFIETGETNHPWRTRTPRQAVKSLFMGFARVVLKNLPVIPEHFAWTFRGNKTYNPEN